ncbi:hypothetical protein J2S74_000386 [Evansella vedderi]|uniref:DUF4127 family protein n=1 Tax=Evansella vedderi TaxID=38282 RepID=A0ABT9ZQ88_9BACI|nr:DUF4127 family protein [Evansella vedderi]MDQ0253014.1 hypothetical protein [Evansella vedderi]
MKKVAILPLDNRPCCYDFTESFGKWGAVQVFQPPKEIIGEFTYFGDTEKISDWLKETAPKVDGMILSIDQLAYGGLIPSRIMERDLETCKGIVGIIKQLREDHPHLLIYAVNVLMRISITTKNKLFTQYWKQVFAYSQLYDRLHRLQEGEVEGELKALEKQIPKEVLQEYLDARERNHHMNQLMIDWVADGTIDFLAITQEDASAVGMHLMEQRTLVKKVFELNVQRKVLVYPGADEATQTLLARMVQYWENSRIKIYPKYASSSGKLEVAKFEDRPVEESVTSHITAAGALVVDEVSEADLVLYVNTPVGGDIDGNHPLEEKAHFNSRHPLLYLIESIEYDLKQGRAVSVADISFPNASDVELVQFLLTENLFFSLTAYAGWNTAGNTLGTCITQSIISIIAQRKQGGKEALEQEHLSFMMERLMDEWAYQANVRGKVNLDITDRLNVDGTNLEGKYEEVNQLVKKEMIPYFNRLVSYLPMGPVSARDNWNLSLCELPWNRTFEVRVKVGKGS